MNQPKSSSYSKTKRIPIYLTSTVLQLCETTPLYRVAKKPSKSAKAKERRQKRKNHSEVLQKTESCRDWSKKRTATRRVPPTTNQRGTERERERVREREREKGREGIHTRHVLPRVKDSRLKRSYFASSSGTSNDQYYDNSSRPQSVAGRFISRHLGHPLSSLRPAVSTPSFQPLVRPLATSRCTSREYGQPYLRVRAWLSGCPG